MCGMARLGNIENEKKAVGRLHAAAASANTSSRPHPQTAPQTVPHGAVMAESGAEAHDHASRERPPL